MGITNMIEIFLIAILSHVILSIAVFPLMALFGHKKRVIYLKPLIDIPLDATKRTEDSLVNINDVKKVRVFHNTESNLENYGYFESRSQSDRLPSISNLTKELDD